MQTTTISLPEWVMQYLVVPIAVGVFTLLWHLGRRELNRQDEGAERRESEIDDLRSDVEALKVHLHDEHSSLEKKVDRIDKRIQAIQQQL